MGRGLSEELAEEYGPGVTVQEVEPGSADDPLNRASPSPAAPPAPAEGATRTGVGTGTGGETLSQEEVEGEEEPGAGATAEEGEEELGEEDATALQRLEEFLDEEREHIRREVREEELPRVQSGLDRQIASLRQENEGLQAQLNEINQQIREQSIAHLTPEQQTEMRQAWATEDAAKENDSYASELISYHDQLEILRLSIEYGEYGVTAEALLDLVERGEVDSDDLVVYCKDQQIAWIRENPTGQAAPKADGARSKPTTQPAPQRRAAPAGARAPSDTGGASPPPPPARQVTGKGVDAMAESVADRDSWETASFPRSRAG